MRISLLPLLVALSSCLETGAEEKHWAFQPLRSVAIPAVEDSSWPRNPIDQFVLAELETHRLTPNSPATATELARRLSYSLTGLPPSEFPSLPLSDERSYLSFVDRLLGSPAYGEQWGRHWLDVARYSDTKGYVYARENRFWVHSWLYRNWVIQFLNDDRGYDEFVRLQIAADQLVPARSPDLAALGFLTLGRRFLGVTHDIIDDRIDVTTRGVLALTVSCARCHDHKYDPIPTQDYYSLYGVFQNSHEQLVPVSYGGNSVPPSKQDQELQERLEAVEAALRKRSAEASETARTRIVDYLKAQLELDKYPEQGFDQIIEPNDLIPETVRQWAAYLQRNSKPDHHVFGPWHDFKSLSAEAFAGQAGSITQRIKRSADLNPLVRDVFATVPASMSEVADRYGKIFQAVLADWNGLRKSNQDATRLDCDDAETIRQILYGSHSPCEVPTEPIVNTERFFASEVCTSLWKLQGKLDQLLLDKGEAVPFATVLRDRSKIVEPRVFLRGNPAQQGPTVPRRLPEVLRTGSSGSFRDGSGRRELAEALADDANPLTSRVIVNRVWAHHFGTGLVKTPSDFGTRAGRPSHPDLLDWLATWFVEHDWSLKQLHRLIVTSASYRQSSRKTPSTHPQGATVDPANRLLWRMSAHRLGWEELRDSLLVASDRLKRSVQAKPVGLFDVPFPPQRTVYGFVDRQYLPTILRTFDFANPALHIARRSETTVAQQALFFMNHDFLADCARRLAARTASAETAELRIELLYKTLFQRAPSESEVGAALQYLRTADSGERGVQPNTLDWQYGFGSYNHKSQRMEEFAPLPYFTGTAWQGGPQLPDARLGWVQLTAQGGHPGNDLAHAAVRRWVAPRRISVRVRSELIHQEASGDGIQAFLVCNRKGLLQRTVLHNSRARFDTGTLELEKGDTIDFAVDILKVLFNDQYQWNPTIQEVGDETAPNTWHASTDFAGPPSRNLDVWEQLAQVLLQTNEFLFVD